MYRKLRLVAILATALATLGFASSASAHTGEFAKFNGCPSTTPGVSKCLLAIINSGKMLIGKNLSIPLVSTVTLQGGMSTADEGSGFSSFYGASNGNTLSKSPQAIPGGLSGLVPPEKSPPIVKQAMKSFLSTPLNAVYVVLELAKPASEIRIGQQNLFFEEGVALTLPVRAHLQNAFLGPNCYVGSSSSPIIFNMTTGLTSPPLPNTPIKGSAGSASFKEEAQIAELTGAKLVDNVWSAPEAMGCGGSLQSLVDPIVNRTIGLPSAIGRNTAILNVTASLALATQVNSH